MTKDLYGHEFAMKAWVRYPNEVADYSMRIKEIRKRLELNQEEFGAKIGVTQPTISRWESGEDEPSYENLRAIADLAKQSLDDFTGLSSPKLVNIASARVCGSVQAGAWVEALEWPPDKKYDVFWKPLETLDKTSVFGLEVRGTSMDRVYPEGSVLICAKVAELGRPPRDGERVIVYRQRGSEIEATVKEYVVDKATGAIWLWPRSNDPIYQAPLPYPAKDSSEEIAVHAIVIASYRPELTA